MFFLKNRLKIASLRIGKHRIVKNIASLRKVNIAHPYLGVGLALLRTEQGHSHGGHYLHTWRMHFVLRDGCRLLMICEG